MDEHEFDRLTRRFVLGGFTAVLGLGMERLLDPASAKKRKKRKKKVKFNEFGCVNVGGFCQNADQCCSGICGGKKGKKKCKDHNSGVGCQEGQHAFDCAGPSVQCTTSTGFSGLCSTTTGNAGFCTHGFICMPCRKDAECREVCGSAAACIQCPDCDGPETFDTACVSPNPTDCENPN